MAKSAVFPLACFVKLPRRSDKISAEVKLVPATLLAVVLGGCATIPVDRYGVARLEVEGTEAMDEESLRACLATEPRSAFSINVGYTSEPECGVPPFDRGRLNLRLWRWPWTDWPVYDRMVFERDLARVERWYRARGYYDARVVSAEFDPPEAARSDRLSSLDTHCERTGRSFLPFTRQHAPESEATAGCEVRVRIRVNEGEPLIVQRITVHGHEALDEGLRQDVEDAVRLSVGDRFDEAEYDLSKRAIVAALAAESHACASVTGSVEYDARAHEAFVDLQVHAGPRAELGRIRVTGHGDLDEERIRAASGLAEGDTYDQEAIQDAQRAVYALGAFSTVSIEPDLGADRCPRAPRPGEAPQAPAGPARVTVPVTISVIPGREIRGSFGAGILSGEVRTDSQLGQSVRQWDVHLLGRFEHRNFLGGLRRFSATYRPRLIFPSQFPQIRTTFETGGVQETVGPQLGNVLNLAFRQPGFIEPRTTMLLNTSWDLGPNDFNQFFRHDLDYYAGLQRSFLSGRLFGYFGLHGNAVFVRRSLVDPETYTKPSNYNLLFWEQTLLLDLRDNARRPRSGMMARLTAHQAGYGLPASWDYVRLTPGLRLYAPLPLGMVLATRFALGMLFVTSFDEALDADSQALGPERYRLRGGGATSNRGFVAGDLGDPNPDDTEFDVLRGGLRRWEASLELRARLTQDTGLVLFFDLGDVNQEPRFRFNYLHGSLGLGFRYDTIVGPVRLDLAWRVPGIQVIGEVDYQARHEFSIGGAAFPGALHITIGDAF